MKISDQALVTINPIGKIPNVTPGTTNAEAVWIAAAIAVGAAAPGPVPGVSAKLPFTK